jgi:ATP-binding cassette subfamily F protein 3
VLSGGERNRYALARMLMMPSNFLLLDEPTNHLDMRAKDVLLTALEEYSGTVVFVSHDRYFIDKLATRVFEVEDGRVHVFPGNYEDYLWRKSGEAGTARRAPSGPGPRPAQSESLLTTRPPSATPENRHPSAAPETEAEPSGRQARLNPIKLRRMKDRQGEIEEEVSKLEAEIADYEAALGNYVSAEETRRLSELLDARRVDLSSLLGEWEEVAQLIEANT